MKKKPLVVDDNGNNLMLAKDLLDNVNSIKHFIELLGYNNSFCYPTIY